MTEYIPIPPNLRVARKVVVEAHAILLDGLATNTAVAQPLRHAGNELSRMDYHRVADAEIALYPGELDKPSGTHDNPTPRVKRAVIHYFRRMLYGEGGGTS